jgi:hypothetical protein
LAELTEVEDAFLLRHPDEAIDLASSGVRQKNSSSTDDESARGTTLGRWPLPLLSLHDDLRTIRLKFWA